MKQLIDTLHSGNYSCVIEHEGVLRTFTQRGINDLYDLYTQEPEWLQGSAIADKVVGKGAAALMVLGGIKTLYTDVISTPALTLLREAGIEVCYKQEVPHIINRDQTGWCPLETATQMLHTAETIYPVIRDFVGQMRQKKSTDIINTGTSKCEARPISTLGKA